MSPQYGELRPTSSWDRLTSLGYPCKFQLLSHLGSFTARHLVVGVSQTLRRWTEGATYIRQGDHHVGHWPTFLVRFCCQYSKCMLLCLYSYLLSATISVLCLVVPAHYVCSPVATSVHMIAANKWWWWWWRHSSVVLTIVIILVDFWFTPRGFFVWRVFVQHPWHSEHQRWSCIFACSTWHFATC